MADVGCRDCVKSAERIFSYRRGWRSRLPMGWQCSLWQALSKCRALLRRHTILGPLSPGTAPLWADIAPLNAQTHQRRASPTQRPVALFEGVINGSRNRVTSSAGVARQFIYRKTGEEVRDWAVRLPLARENLELEQPRWTAGRRGRWICGVYEGEMGKLPILRWISKRGWHMAWRIKEPDP